MKFFHIVLFGLVVLSGTAGVKAAAFDQIPPSHQSHPELAQSTDASSGRASYELVHLRTAHSRTILNADTTRTSTHSATPLHYQDESGFWLSLRDEITVRGEQKFFPSHDPSFVFHRVSGRLDLLAPDRGPIAKMVGLELIFVDRNGASTRTVGAVSEDASIAGRNTLSFTQPANGLTLERQFHHGALISSYVLQSADAFDPQFGYLLIEEQVDLADGLRLEYEFLAGEPTNRILIMDDDHGVVSVIHPPIVSDQQAISHKLRNLHVPYQASLSYRRTDDSSYVLQIRLSADWITDEQRAYPLVARSVITLENNDTVSSCYSPQFQQAALQVAVPAGETVLWTDIEYDFVAINQGWVSDQRSFVSGPAGSTTVFSGPANSEGTHTYSVNLSEIGNGLSTGQVEYVFHASRTWGGSGCNASFNFISRRLLSVTYGSVVFGDGPVTVNEFSASNRSFEDSFGRTEDWIELHNMDPDNFFNLSGYYLSNDASDPTMWQISDGIIPPGGYLLVFASRRDISSGMVQHANFNLTQLRPDQIVLTDPDGEVVEVHAMPVTQVNHSYGRTADEPDTWVVFEAPSPGSSNGGGFTGYASRPVFSVPAGSHQGSVVLAMESSGDNEQIRYTTDGSTPVSSSALYVGPLVLSETTVVRARAFSSEPDVLPGFIETATFFVDEQVSLPVFSFSGDSDLLALFNGNAALRPLGHFEYFESDGQFVDGNFGDFNKHGNDSWSYPQRGVDFISRDDYGYQRRLEHKFFATSDRTRFRRLMVKAAANDNYPFEAGGAHIRDSYIQTLSQLAGLDLDERSSTNVLVFVNGQYWGVYDLRERVDDNNFTSHYYGQDYLYRDSDIYLQFLKTWQGTSAHFGNQRAVNDWAGLRQYVQNNDMGDPGHFEYVTRRLNIQSLIDYFVINSYVVSRDWLNYNTGWWRGLDPSGSARQWRYILWDMEAALGHFINYTGLPDPTHTAPPCQAENLTVGNGHTAMLRKLIQQNPDVRQQYVSRYVDLLNTHFSAENAIALLDDMIDVIAPEMPRHVSRWGGNMGTWQSNVQAIRTFLANRYNYLMDVGLSSCYGLSGPFATEFRVVPENAGSIRMNSEWLPHYPFSARLFGNIETRLTARGAPGHSFSHWEIDGNVVFPDEDEGALAIVVAGAGSVTAHFNPPATEGDLLYYWHFNDLFTPQDVTQILPDYALVDGSAALMTYTGSGPRDIDANETGSDLNLHLGVEPGSSARVRNPSEGRSLLFDLPTTGFEQINFSYAVERTNNGMLMNILSYSLDGVSFQQDGLPAVEFELDEASVYYFVNIDFSDIEGANDNPDFKIRVEFAGNTTGSSGNNRFDNISLKGVEIVGDTPARLAFLAVNGGEPIYAGEPFSVLVQVQDDDGLPVPVEADTEVSLSVFSGQGVLIGNSLGTVPAGAHSLLISELVYSVSEAEVVLAALVDGLEPGSSPTFPVLQRSYRLSLSQNVQGAGAVSGEGQFVEGESVLVAAIVKDGFVFDAWLDEAGSVFSTEQEVAFSMPGTDLAYQAIFSLADNGSLLHYWHFNDLEAGTLSAVVADFSAVGIGVISYPGLEDPSTAGVMDRRSHGNNDPVSNFNLLLDQAPDAGHVLRVRNPSSENMLLIEASSEGYMDIVVSFATTRTNNGADRQQFFLSTDAGLSWTAIGEDYTVATLNDDGYVAKTFHLAEMAGVNNNPDLKFKILFLGDAAANDSGNNRFDNLSVHGLSIMDNVDPVFSDRFQE
ncbi:MAG: hypothetical protein EA418_03960 [Wenzhouxiangellaceae bacterium]|nr:MAG: hypothetical protein EA418_03960 [Wenzhouxiangellaceae bacterium]